VRRDFARRGERRTAARCRPRGEPREAAADPGPLLLICFTPSIVLRTTPARRRRLRGRMTCPRARCPHPGPRKSRPSSGTWSGCTPGVGRRAARRTYGEATAAACAPMALDCMLLQQSLGGWQLQRVHAADRVLRPWISRTQMGCSAECTNRKANAAAPGSPGPQARRTPRRSACGRRSAPPPHTASHDFPICDVGWPVVREGARPGLQHLCQCSP
jgi:hypothetical protein